MSGPSVNAQCADYCRFFPCEQIVLACRLSGIRDAYRTELSVRPSFIKSQLNAAHRPLVSDLQPAFLRDPATWSHHERVAQYRVLAARYRRMAETEDRPFARDGLLELARECETVAEQR